ncbi:ComEC/Rec2 family competence protein [Chloroflexota bacterium]
MRRKWHALAFVIMLGVLILLSYSVFAAGGTTTWVSFINVGQGDSILVQVGGGFDVLIDGGDKNAGDDVLAYLRSRSVDDIDVMVATHADADHIGGLIDVLAADDIPVERVLFNGYPGTSKTWENFVAAVAAEGLTLEATSYPDTHLWGAVTVYILNPLPGLTNPNQNDASVVILIDHMNIEILLTGDVEESVELDVASRGIPYWIGSECCAEVLKVAHHGSNSSTSVNFLATVQPDDAVISVGDNSYGHPSDEILARLSGADVTVWRTDEKGTILAISSGISVELMDLLKRVFVPVVQK